MFKNMKMNTRLLLLLSISVLFLLGAILGGMHQLYNLKENLTTSLLSERAEFDAVMAIDSAQTSFKTQVQDWKDILIRGGNPEDYEKYLSQFVEQEKRVQAYLQTAIPLMRKQGITTNDAENLISTHEQLGAKYRDALKSYDKQSPQAAQTVDKLVKGMDRPAALGMTKVSEQIRSHAQQFSQEHITSAEST